jgi:4a-hydroxytetrahydrobiopterin dehydratase
MTNFLEQKCTQRAAAMSEAEISNHLAQMSGWRETAKSIEKTYSFKNWLETLAFVNALGWVCHIEDHHPDLSVSFNRCVVRFSTHSADGISRNDFICAAKADALIAFVG